MQDVQLRSPLMRTLNGLQTFVLIVIIVAPIAWMVLSSFKNRVDVTRIPPPLFFEPTLDNYRELFIRSDFLQNTLNSFIVAGGSTLLGLVLAIPAAFAISWHRFTWPATVTLFARLAPGTLFLLPWFLMFSELRLTGTHLVLIVTHAVITMPVALWTLLPYFDGFPRELVESAQMDGCRSWDILGRIVLPVIAAGHRRRDDPVVRVLLELLLVRPCPLGQQDQDGRGRLVQLHRRRRDQLGRADGGGNRHRVAATDPHVHYPAPPRRRIVHGSGQGMMCLCHQRGADTATSDRGRA